MRTAVNDIKILLPEVVVCARETAVLELAILGTLTLLKVKYVRSEFYR